MPKKTGFSEAGDNMSEWQSKLLALVIGGVLSAAIIMTAGRVPLFTASGQAQRTAEEISVVIDAGHGGSDPGKVGINGVLEKDINLNIALKVKTFLEANDVKVILTRDTDEGLYDADASNKKVQDMKRRVSLIEENAPVVTVSIHQNSYPEEYVHGAQVFYYDTSAEGKKLAQILQTRLVEDLDPENKRQIKANDSYYLLKNTATPIVIVECGFLTNREEADKLCTDWYQEKLAWSIHLGILQYLNGGGQKNAENG